MIFGFGKMFCADIFETKIYGLLHVIIISTFT